MADENNEEARDPARDLAREIGRRVDSIMKDRGIDPLSLAQHIYDNLDAEGSPSGYAYAIRNMRHYGFYRNKTGKGYNDGWSRYHSGDQDPLEVVSLVLQSLNLNGEDSLVQDVRKTYSGFIFPDSVGPGASHVNVGDVNSLGKEELKSRGNDYDNLSGALVDRVWNRMSNLCLKGQDVGEYIAENMGVSTGTAANFINDMMRNRISSALPHFETRVDDELIYLPLRATKAKGDNRRVRKISALLDLLGTNPEDELVRQIKTIYPDFIYPRKKRYTGPSLEEISESALSEERKIGNRLRKILDLQMSESFDQLDLEDQLIASAKHAIDYDLSVDRYDYEKFKYAAEEGRRTLSDLEDIASRLGDSFAASRINREKGNFLRASKYAKDNGFLGLALEFLDGEISDEDPEAWRNYVNGEVECLREEIDEKVDKITSSDYVTKETDPLLALSEIADDLDAFLMNDDVKRERTLSSRRLSYHIGEGKERRRLELMLKFDEMETEDIASPIHVRDIFGSGLGFLAERNGNRASLTVTYHGSDGTESHIYGPDDVDRPENVSTLDSMLKMFFQRGNPVTILRFDPEADSKEDEEARTDFLGFYQQIKKELGIEASFRMAPNMSHRKREQDVEGAIYRRREPHQDQEILSGTSEYKGKKLRITLENGGYRHVHKDLVDFRDGGRLIGGKSIDDIDFDHSLAEDFGWNADNIGFEVRVFDPEDESNYSFGFFPWSRATLEGNRKPVRVHMAQYESYEDIESTVGLDDRDFRPYLHRALEMFAGVPREEWHNPEIYLPEAEHEDDSGQEGLEGVIDATVNLLFSGDERSELEGQIEEARLHMRKGWISVPRLNLGPVQLPTPGMKDVADDDFVTTGASYLVEYLSSMGIMPIEQAEELAVRKLTSHFVNRSGFQLSRDRAEGVVKRLRENAQKKEKSEEEAAA